MTEGSLTEVGFQRWLPVQEVTGSPEARPRRRCCSEFNHLGSVGRPLVGVNEVHQEAQLGENSRIYRSDVVLWFPVSDYTSSGVPYTLQRSDGRLEKAWE